MPQIRQHVPWKAAGRASEEQHSADDVVRRTGWVFNNRTGGELTLEEFVASGDHEVPAYLQAFGLWSDGMAGQTLVEIGAGIGRMTAAFTRLFARVYACDLDAAFLERCRETVAQHGVPEHLLTIHVADGRTLAIPDDAADLTFSYITLQHCRRDDALALVAEAIRVTRPGGKVALNLRTWTGGDVALVPLGRVMRLLWRVPKAGPWLSRRRAAARLGWQANRLTPKQVIDANREAIEGITIVHAPTRSGFGLPDTVDRTFEGVHPSHWWLIATVADTPAPGTTPPAAEPSRR